MEKTLHLSRLEPHLAAALLVGCEGLDPTGQTAREDLPRMAAEGACFLASTEGAQAVYVVSVVNGVAWVNACKGAGPVDWPALLLPAIEAQAKGCASVGFQTARRGLVRKARRQGYEVAGWIMRKKIQ